MPEALVRGEHSAAAAQTEYVLSLDAALARPVTADPGQVAAWGPRGARAAVAQVARR